MVNGMFEGLGGMDKKRKKGKAGCDSTTQIFLRPVGPQSQSRHTPRRPLAQPRPGLQSLHG